MNYDSYRTTMRADLIDGMQPSGEWEFSLIRKSNACPKRLVAFDRAVTSKDVDGWAHFFIHDSKFARLYNDPWRYLPILARFDGVISPDCSVFWDYPLYRQMQSIGQSREMGAWLQRNGISVIPCVRWGKENTYGFAFDGIEPEGTIAVGTAGAMRETEPRMVFEAGFEPMLDALRPRRIIVYGSRKSPVFEEAEQRGIQVLAFETDTAGVFAEKGR